MRTAAIVYGVIWIAFIILVGFLCWLWDSGIPVLLFFIPGSMEFKWESKG